MTRDDVLRIWEEAGHPDFTLEDHFTRFAALVAAAENEACAKVCEEAAQNSDLTWYSQLRLEDCAAAIRARKGETNVDR